jgi:uncharacterized protein YvpB
LDFQYALPFSDNPETGFVGNPRNLVGSIPPYPYGVHAGSVAALLRAYGVPALDHRSFPYEDLHREIAAGKPVIVWVISGVVEGNGVAYTASDGQTTIVAPMEHTVMVVGYTPEAVVIQDGGGRYNVPVERFLRSGGGVGESCGYCELMWRRWMTKLVSSELFAQTPEFYLFIRG